MLDPESVTAAFPGCWKIPELQQSTPFKTLLRSRITGNVAFELRCAFMSCMPGRSS